MNVFTPYASPYKNAKCLDPKRRNKQILEICQIISANTGIDIGWKIPKYVYNHPNTLKWKGHESYLVFYLFQLTTEYSNKSKGKIHKVVRDGIENQLYEMVCYLKITLPTWFTKESCYEHQALLISKKPEFYGPIFNRRKNG